MAERDKDGGVQDLAEEVAIVVLDIVGIFDPTGAADVASGSLSFKRGDWWGAGFSLLGVFPILGDLAKTGKLGRYARTIQKAVAAAVDNPAARRVLEGALRQLWNVLSKIDLRRLPGPLRRPLQSMLTDLGRLFGRAANRVMPKVDWEIVDSSGWQSLVNVTSGRGAKITSAGLKIPDSIRMRVGSRHWNIGRNSSKLKDGNPIGSVFKHFAERTGTVAVSNRAGHAAVMETALAHLLADFQRKWAAGLLKQGDKTIAAGFRGDIRTVIDGWEIGVDTRESVFRLYHVVFK